MENGEYLQETSEGTLPSAAPPLDSVQTITPSVIDLLSMTGMIAFEGVILGRYSSAALAGGGMGMQLLFFLFTLLLTLIAGAAIPISRFLGAGDREKADRLFAVAISTTLLLGIFFAVFSLVFQGFIFNTVFGAEGDVERAATDYFSVVALFMPMIALNFGGTGILRATGDTVASMTTNLIANLINAGLAVILVYGYSPLNIPSLGAAGAALALGIAQTFGFIIQLRLILGGKTKITLHFRDIIKPRLSRLKRILKSGVPVTLEQFIWMSGQLIILAYITRLGIQELAAHQIILRLTQTLGVVYQGYAFGNLALCGQKIGAGKEESAASLSRNIRYLSLITGIAFAVIVYIFDENLVSLFSRDSEVFLSALAVIPILALQQIPKSQTMITASELRARGDLMFIVKAAGICVVLFEVTLSYIAIFIFKWGLSAIWSFMVMDELVRFVVHLLRLKRRIVIRV